MRVHLGRDMVLSTGSSILRWPGALAGARGLDRGREERRGWRWGDQLFQVEVLKAFLQEQFCLFWGRKISPAQMGIGVPVDGIG